MYMCVYIYIYISIYLSLSLSIHIYIYIHTYVYRHTHIYVCSNFAPGRSARLFVTRAKGLRAGGDPEASRRPVAYADMYQRGAVQSHERGARPHRRRKSIYVILDFSVRAVLTCFPHDTSLRSELRNPNISEPISRYSSPHLAPRTASCQCRDVAREQDAERAVTHRVL